MDIPDLVQQAAGDEGIEAGVSLDDEDAVCLTPTRTLVYTGDGLLSDEAVEEFPHDVERVAVSEGRRKTKFVLEYIDGTRSFTVPANRDDKVLELVLEGVLRAESVIDDRESLVGVYRFSELTLIVAENRIVKLVGEQVWNDDYEVYPYEDVTGLEFERASVATSVVVSVDGRPQRIKVPNDEAPVVRQTIQKALFAYYDVASLEELNRVVGGADGGVAAADTGEANDLDFGPGIDPLVTDDEEDAAEHAEEALEDIPTSDDAGTKRSSTDPSADAEPDAPSAAEPGDGDAATKEDAAAADAGAAGADDATRKTDEDSADSPGDGRDAEPPDESTASETGADESASGATTETGGDAAGGTDTDATDATAGRDAPEAGTTGVASEIEPASREDLAAVADRVEELTEAVDRQNELLKRQHRAIKQLVDELQSD